MKYRYLCVIISMLLMINLILFELLKCINYIQLNIYIIIKSYTVLILSFHFNLYFHLFPDCSFTLNNEQSIIVNRSDYGEHVRCEWKNNPDMVR